MIVIMDGTKVRRLRMRQERSQEQVAAACEVSQMTVSKIENESLKTISLDLGMKIANCLGADINELVKTVGADGESGAETV